ncbi:MAG: DUF3857 domain-containing protein [Elusimicrobiota bacterium]
MILALLLLVGTARADVVFLNKGDEVSGTVERIADGKLILKGKGGPQVYDTKDVQKVKLVREWDIEGEDSPGRIKSQAVQKLLKAPPKPEQYPDDGYYIQLLDRTYTLNKDRRWSRRTHTVRYILRERGKDAGANVRVSYLGGAESAKVDFARSVTSGTVSWLDDTSMQDASENYRYPLYDRLRSLKYSVPNVNVGSIVEFSHAVEVSSGGRARPFFGESYFQMSEPMGVCRLRVIVPKGVKLAVQADGLPAGAVVKKSESDGTVTYLWEVSNVRSLRREDSMPPFARVVPRVAFAVQDDWKAIQAELAAAAEANRALSPEMKAKVAELGKDPEAVYAWVAREIKQVPVEMEDFSYVPRPAQEIFRTKAGNSLDKPFLYYAMLREAGFDASFVYLKDKDKSPFLRRLPSVRQFSTGAVLLRTGTAERFIAPLSDVRRVSELPGDLQGTWGLLLRKGDRVLVQTPVLGESRESQQESVEIELKPDGSIETRESVSFSGRRQAGLRGLKDLKPEELRKWVEQVVYEVHPNAKLRSYRVENLEDLGKDIVFSLEYGVEDYALKAGDKFLAFRVPGLKYPAGDVGKPEREHPMFWMERDKQADSVSIRLPKGYKLYHLPKGLSLKSKAGSYRASYTEEGDTIRFEDSFVREATEVLPADYAEYKAQREGAARFADEWIVLTR